MDGLLAWGCCHPIRDGVHVNSHTLDDGVNDSENELGHEMQEDTPTEAETRLNRRGGRRSVAFHQCIHRKKQKDITTAEKIARCLELMVDNTESDSASS